jgi:hypothetical protein
MSNDAKLGLVLGVGLVMAIAVLFYRKEPVAVAPRPERPAQSAGVADGPPQGQHRAAQAKSMSRSADEAPHEVSSETPPESER